MTAVQEGLSLIIKKDLKPHELFSMARIEFFPGLNFLGYQRDLDIMDLQITKVFLQVVTRKFLHQKLVSFQALYSFVKDNDKLI